MSPLYWCLFFWAEGRYPLSVHVFTCSRNIGQMENGIASKAMRLDNRQRKNSLPKPSPKSQ